MPPRRDDDKMVLSTAAQSSSSDPFYSPASRPRLFDLPKDISFLDMQQPSLPVQGGATCSECVVRQRMASSLDKATKRTEAIQQRIEREEIKTQYPFVYEACRSALVDEMSRVLGQASLLLEDATKEEDVDVSQMTKNKRLSVSLLNAIQYLDTLETAMSFSSRGRLEAGISTVLAAIHDKCKDDLVDSQIPLKVCVSSWTAPSLAFDFRTGSPTKLSLAARKYDPLSLPLELEVKAIIEYSAEELIQSPSLDGDAFVVTVKKCNHEMREHGTRDGITGEAMVQVHIVPLAQSKIKKEVVWGLDDDVETVRVKEVRATQQNAYPTKFRINFDMFASTVYGESGVTLTLAMETCQTMDGEVPRLQIELVVDP